MSDVLLLHAGIADRRMWAAQIEALSGAGHRVLAPDLPGFGNAPLEPGTIAYVDYAAGLLDGPGALVGCSFGGRVALELVLARPELAERLVLIGAGLGRWDWSASAQAGFAEEEEALERGALAEAAAAQASMWLAADADPAVRELTEAMTIRSYEQQLPLEGKVKAVWPERSAEERLGEIGVPTLVVLGAEDVEDIAQMAEKLVAGISGARLETIEGSGHLPSLERPDELNALLLDFLDDGV
jgi:3-oxoadipate enol-lactonase